jgi:hypothetical protein
MMANQYSQYGYVPTGDTEALLSSTNPYMQQQGQNLAYGYGRQYDQEEHEKQLQAQEQQRRQYDSETARQLGHEKNQFLGGLLNQSRRYM